MTVPVYHIRNYCSTNTGKNHLPLDKSHFITETWKPKTCIVSAK